MIYKKLIMMQWSDVKSLQSKKKYLLLLKTNRAKIFKEAIKCEVVFIFYHKIFKYKHFLIKIFFVINYFKKLSHLFRYYMLTKQTEPNNRAPTSLLVGSITRTGC